MSWLLTDGSWPVFSPFALADRAVTSITECVVLLTWKGLVGRRLEVERLGHPSGGFLSISPPLAAGLRDDALARLAQAAELP